MKNHPTSPLPKILGVVILLAGATFLAGCADTSSEPPKRLVEHQNPMGGPSSYTFRPADSSTPALQH